MLSPTGIIPEELMYPQKLGEVMALIKGMALSGSQKRELLQGWARTVGLKIRASQYQSVYRTGWDIQGAATEPAQRQ